MAVETFFGNREAVIESAGSIIIENDRLPWIKHPVEVNLSTIAIRNEKSVFFFGSAIKGHSGLLEVADKMDKIMSATSNRIFTMEIARMATNSGQPPVLKSGLAQIHYEKHKSGVRSYFTVLNISDAGKQIPAYIKVAALGVKSDEPYVLRILTGNGSSSGSR